MYGAPGSPLTPPTGDRWSTGYCERITVLAHPGRCLARVPRAGEVISCFGRRPDPIPDAAVAAGADHPAYGPLSYVMVMVDDQVRRSRLKAGDTADIALGAALGQQEDELIAVQAVALMPETGTPDVRSPRSIAVSLQLGPYGHLVNIADEPAGELAEER